MPKPTGKKQQWQVTARESWVMLDVEMGLRAMNATLRTAQTVTALVLAIGILPALARRDPAGGSGRTDSGGSGISRPPTRSAPSIERRDWSPRPSGDMRSAPSRPDASTDPRSYQPRRDYAPRSGGDRHWPGHGDYRRHGYWRGSYYYYYGWYPYGYCWPYRSWYWGPSYSYYYYGYSPRYDYTRAPSYHTTQAAQTYYQVGVLWGVDLRHKLQTTDKLVAYLRDHVLTAEQINQDEFRRGFILGYGEGAEMVYEKAFQEVAQKK